MKDATLTGTGPHTEQEYEVEIDRLGAEIRQMLDETRRNNEEFQRLSQVNRQTLDELEKFVLCWKG